MLNSHLKLVKNTNSNTDSPASRGLEQLADQITQLSAHLDAGTYQLLVLIAEFDERKGWFGPGLRSCAHWLNWKCGLSLNAARERVRVARALRDLPQISASMRDGRLSYSKARAMTRVATPENENALLEVALGGTASHVEQQVRLYRKVKRIEALEHENTRHARRELNWHQDEDGSWVIRGRLAPEQGAVIVKALEAAVDALFEEHKNVAEDVSAETSTPLTERVSEPVATRRADAMERMAEAYLAHQKNGLSGGDRTLVNLHTGTDTLRADGGGAEAELEGHGNVSAETSRRLACDCSVVHWQEDSQGQPLSIGRKSRTIPPSIRRALNRRDGGCRFPGCTCDRFVDAHHVKHWADGGETSLDNLVLLCRQHHRLVHEGGFGVQAGASGEFVFSRPTGTQIPEGPDIRFRGNVFALEAGNQRRGLHISPETPIPAWYGDRLDPDLAVHALLACEQVDDRVI